MQTSCDRVAKRNRSSVALLLSRAAAPWPQLQTSSDKTRLKVAHWPKISLARLTPQTHSVCLLHRTAASFTLSVTGLVNGRRLAAARAAFAVVVGPAAASTVGAAAWQARHRCCVGAGCVSCCLCAPPCLELLITPLCVKREQDLRKKSTFLGTTGSKIAAARARAKKSTFP